MIYLLFKFLHVVTAILWLGGMILLTLLNIRIARTGDVALMRMMEKQSEYVGSRIAGPAAGLTLLTGFAAIAFGRIGFPFWVNWGIGSVVVSILLGAIFMRRLGLELSSRLAGSDSRTPEIVALQKRLATLAWINIIVLLSAEWAMVFKPTL